MSARVKNMQLRQMPWLMGGHVLSYKQLLALARTLNPECPKEYRKDIMNSFLIVREAAHKRNFVLVFCFPNGNFKAGDVIFVSRIRRYKQGREGQTDFPRFEPNATDNEARNFLEKLGVVDLKYETRLSGVHPDNW